MTSNPKAEREAALRALVAAAETVIDSAPWDKRAPNPYWRVSLELAVDRVRETHDFD